MQKDKYGFEIIPTIEDLSSYESPIQVAYREIQNAFDNDVLKAVLSYGISVDKDELIRALQYDRKQYEKGFADGVRAHLGDDAVPVVRCKDCKYWGGITFGRTCRMFSGMNTRIEMREDGFCSYGERRSGDD